MDELIAFLAARYDEAEALAANPVAPGQQAYTAWYLAMYHFGAENDAQRQVAARAWEQSGSADDDRWQRGWEAAASAVGADSAARLRDVAAKRAILDWLGHQDRVYGDYSVIETLELVVRHLGAEFSDHPDYPAEWCPECEDGLVRVAGCNCGDGLPPYGHEPLCGWEECPNGCWERLHPQQDQPSGT